MSELGFYLSDFYCSWQMICIHLIVISLSLQSLFYSKWYNGQLFQMLTDIKI